MKLSRDRSRVAAHPRSYTLSQAKAALKELASRIEAVDEETYDEVADQFTELISPLYSLVMNTEQRASNFKTHGVR